MNLYQKLKAHKGHKLYVLAPGGFQETGGVLGGGTPGVAVLACKTCDSLVLDAGEFDGVPDPRPSSDMDLQEERKLAEDLCGYIQYGPQG